MRSALAKVTGWLSVFGNVDRQGEIVDQWAYASWIRENPGKQLPLLWVHNKLQIPVGSATVTESEYGLEIRGRIEDTPDGRALVAYVEGMEAEAGGAKVHMGASPGYNILSDYWDRGIRHLKDLQLMEATIAPQGWAANPEAKITISPVEGLE